MWRPNDQKLTIMFYITQKSTMYHFKSSFPKLEVTSFMNVSDWPAQSIMPRAHWLPFKWCAHKWVRGFGVHFGTAPAFSQISTVRMHNYTRIPPDPQSYHGQHSFSDATLPIYVYLAVDRQCSYWSGNVDSLSDLFLDSVLFEVISKF